MSADPSVEARANGKAPSALPRLEHQPRIPNRAMSFRYDPAPSSLTAEYIRLRGMTRENPVSEARLREHGITVESWADEIESGELAGTTAHAGDRLVGYCFGNTRSGEVVVLAVLPDAEGQGVGRQLLTTVIADLQSRGHRRLFLGCSADPRVRSYGFYRHLGWRSTGAVDPRNDEVLELILE